MYLYRAYSSHMTARSANKRKTGQDRGPSICRSAGRLQAGGHSSMVSTYSGISPNSASDLTPDSGTKSMWDSKLKLLNFPPNLMRIHFVRVLLHLSLLPRVVVIARKEKKKHSQNISISRESHYSKILTIDGFEPTRDGMWNSTTQGTIRACTSVYFKHVTLSGC